MESRFRVGHRRTALLPAAEEMQACRRNARDCDLSPSEWQGHEWHPGKLLSRLD